MDEQVRVVLAGTGSMGTDHLHRLVERTDGATVAAVAEPDPARRTAALDVAPGAAGYDSLGEALAAGGADAVLIATPAPCHEEQVVTAVAAGLPVLCEKPLAPDRAAAARIVAAEQAAGRRLVQVGFMRRFDDDYRTLRALVESGEAGDLLTVHAAHRMASVAPDYRESMMITDSLVHELDVLPWAAGAPVVALAVRRARADRRLPVASPIQLLMTLADGVSIDVELNLAGPAGYQVNTEAVFADRVLHIAPPPQPDYRLRFAQAYDSQVQAWIDAVRAGTAVGPSAWDGYRAAVACDAGLAALAAPGVVVDVPAEPVPAFYLN
ncbi:Gfo/Idh/MocA family protein [Gordonia sp. VNK21]|uniref:Gfo/Idh/MocA family protein n=1 Tax=Gordonia sp. VNK21 TaxID=3382483 RepID=UPI0038D39CF0